MKTIKIFLVSALFLLAIPTLAIASEADLQIPPAVKEQTILYFGFLVTLLGLLFGGYQFVQVKKLPAHKSMLDIAEVIYQTCVVYLKQQGKFLAVLFAFVGLAF